ncbi:MAG: hypothetical protein WCK76_00345 [Elusimicrobiota bacterium]
MKLHGGITINGRNYAQGADVPWYFIYPFFMFHMLMFGGSGFFMAYGDAHAPLPFLYMHGGLAITVYTMFYIVIFGLDDVKWMFINAGLGLLAIYTQVSWLLSLFGKKIGDYPFSVHVVPFLYYILYTFLLRHALLDITRAHDDENRKQAVEYFYIALSLTASLASYYLERAH